MTTQEITYKKQRNSLKRKDEIVASFKGVKIGIYRSFEQAERCAPYKLERMKAGQTDKHIQEILNS